MINYLGVLVCAIAAMIIGSVWYGPLFGKMWMQVMGVDMSKMTSEECKKLQKGMGPTYVLQFILSLVTAGVLSYHISHWAIVDTSAVVIAVCVWFGFIMTTTAGACLWSGKPKNLAWKMFFISAGAQLVTFIVFGLILSYWN